MNGGLTIFGDNIRIERTGTRTSRKRSHVARSKASRHNKNRRAAHQKRVYRKAPHHYTSHKRIHYTKNGQPYIILRGGKARFITRRGAKMSRKEKGGRY